MSSGNPALSLEEAFLTPASLEPPPVRRALLIFLLCLTALLHLATIGWGDLYNETDGQYAGAAREMLESHQWFTPTNDGIPRLQKPLLLYWAIAVSLKIFGLNTAAVRLPMALATMASIAFTFLIGDRLGGPWRGFLAGLIHLCCCGAFIFGRMVMPEPLFGAFIAGALLAESSYRHELEADIAPFEGLLLGIFFTAIGMSLNLGLLVSEPQIIVTLTILLIVIKALVLFLLGRLQGLASGPSRRLALALSQGGEFAFVLLSVGRAAGVLGSRPSEILAVVVTLSMALTPLLLMLDRVLSRRAMTSLRAFDELPEADGHVVIAGFGRFGQITARVLRAKGVPFTALDISAEQVEFVKRFGSKAFFGDASRSEVLEAAQIDKARAFVLAIDDVEAAMRAAEIVKTHYPHVPIYARARDRAHAHRLLDLGVAALRRETFLASLDLTRELLKGLGYSDRIANRTVNTFKAHDERRLIEDYKLASDVEKLQERARGSNAMLEKLFREDEIEEAKLAQTESNQREAKLQREPRVKV